MSGFVYSQNITETIKEIPPSSDLSLDDKIDKLRMYENRQTILIPFEDEVFNSKK
jgi:hypothetical protein